jgi:hypothetical protein
VVIDVCTSPRVPISNTQYGNERSRVWNKGAEIDFVSPGKGTMTATFEIPMVEIEQLREESADNQKHLPVFYITVTDADDTVVARLKKTLYVRRKRTVVDGRHPKPIPMKD